MIHRRFSELSLPKHPTIYVTIIKKTKEWDAVGAMFFFFFTAATEKKNIFVFYDRTFYKLVWVSVDSLIPPETPLNTPCEAEHQMLPYSVGKYVSFAKTCICTFDGGKQSLYFFGGQRLLSLKGKYAVREVYHYDLSIYPKLGRISLCEKMIHKTFKPLAVQVGDDCISVLGKTSLPPNYYNNYEYEDGDDDDGRLDYAFQGYNFKKDKWTVLADDKGGLFDINKCDCGDKSLRDSLEFVPHVVIGSKLHVSVGNSSFTFDTVKHAWEDCKLFETFWSAKKESGLTPSNFYGERVWNVTKKVMKKNKYGGPPFGFSGRAVLWDENVLLGVHYAKNCPVVAFLLNEDGNVVKSQPFSLNNLGNNLAMANGCLRRGARVVDLGGDGYFGLVHLVAQDPHARHKPSLDGGRILNVELVTFKVSRPRSESGSSSGASDCEHFLECEVVRKDVVANDCSEFTWPNFYAFSG